MLYMLKPGMTIIYSMFFLLPLVPKNNIIHLKMCSKVTQKNTR